MLVRWCPDVVSMSRVLQFTENFGANVVSFGAHFGTSGDHRAIGTWEHKKGDLRSRAWISLGVGWMSGPHF